MGSGSGSVESATVAPCWFAPTDTWRADTAEEKQLQALRTAVAGLLGHDTARTSNEDRLEMVAG
jgi:hypothetical protein